MSKFVKFVLITIVILFALLLIVPHLISFESYKETIITEAKKATGRDLEINGKIALSILPKPSIDINDVRLLAPKGAIELHTFEVEKASAALSLSSLIFGKIEIAYIDLKHPVINLEELKNGSKSWEFAPVNNDMPTAKMEAQPSVSIADKSLALPISIGFIHIDSGTINYINSTGRNTIEKFNALAYSGDLSGPISLKADFLTSGEKIVINTELANINKASPFTAEIHAYGQLVHLSGDLGINENSFSGKIDSSGSFKQFIDENNKNIPTEISKPYKFNANIDAKNQDVTFNNVAFDMGSFAIKGAGSYKSEIDTANLNLTLADNTGNLDLSYENVKKQNGKIQLHSKAIKPFMNALGINTNDMPSLINQPFSFETIATSNGNKHTFSNLVISSADATLKGSLSFASQNNQTLFNYNLITDNAVLLAKAANIDLPIKLHDVVVKGETTINGDVTDTNTAIIAAKANIAINGKFNKARADDTKLDFSLTGENLANTFRQIEVAPPFSIGKFSISGVTTGDFTKKFDVVLNKANFGLNDSVIALSGKTSIDLSNSKPSVNIDFKTDRLNLDYLLASSPKTMTGSAASQQQQIKPNVAAAARWSKEKIDLSGLQNIDAAIKLSIKSLNKGSLTFDNISLVANIKNGELDIDSIKSGLFGGTLESSGKISSNKNQTISIKASLKNADLRNIQTTSNQFKVTKGRFNLDLSTNTHGNSELDLVNALDGNINFNATEGALSGFDLQKVINGLKQVKNLDSVLKMLDNSFSGGETHFKTLKSQIALDKGVATIKEFNVETYGAKAQLEGNVNLPNYTLDTVATVTIDLKNIPPFKVRFFGALDNPSHKLDTKALQDFLVKNVLGNVLENLNKGKMNPKDLLGNLLGGKNTPSDGQAPSNNQQQPANKPIEQLITKGLGNLFKK